MSGQLLYFGLTHRTAGPDMRGRFLCDNATRLRILADLGEFFPERILVSTCGRFEIYAVAPIDHADCNPESRASSEQNDAAFDFPLGNVVLGRLADWFGLAIDDLAGHVRVMHGAPVAEHLLRVASGLESRILGEPQILTQVRRAYLEADEVDSVGPILSALGRAAIHAGRRVRRETSINQTAQSSATLAVDHAESRVQSLQKSSVVVLGTGHLAGDVLNALIERHPGSVTVVGRNAESAVELARRIAGVGCGLSELPRVVAAADVLITCASSPAPLVGMETVTSSRDRKLCIVDLAVPRNVDPALRSNRFVELVHLDELLGFDRPVPLTDQVDAASKRERVGPNGPVAMALDIVHSELIRFLAWQRERSVVPDITQLVRTALSAPIQDWRTTKRRLHSRIMAIKAAVAA